MQRLSTWRICRSCAQQWGIPLRSRPRKIGQLRDISFTTQSLRKTSDDDNTTDVHFYEQFAPGKKGIRPISQDEFEGKAAADEIKERIKKLEDQLRLLEAGKEVKDLSDEDRKILDGIADMDEVSAEELKKMMVDEVESGREAEDLNDFDFADDLDLEFHLPPEHQQSLDKLAKLLQGVASEPDSTRQRRLLWQQYTLCKDQLPGFEEQLPKNAWDILWHSQYSLEAAEGSRSNHLWVLVDDLARHGQKLSPEQLMTRIEGRVADKKYKEAWKFWQEARGQLQGHAEISEAFRDLGVLIAASSQRPKDAQTLALELSSDFPRVITFIPVIEAWLREGTTQSLGKAWALYVRIRLQLMNKNISLEDYDKLVMTFFKAGHTQTALAIFKDLVLAGRHSKYDTLEIRNKSGAIYKELSEQAEDTEALNELSLTTLAVVPRRFQNKFFYAMWMKRLIGMEEIEAAASVAELMYLRGVRADARHINGLIGALFRRGRPNDKDLAVKLGWAMIHERHQFVALRNATDAGQDPPPVPDDPTRHLPPYLGKNLPPATIETFSLLLQYYTRGGMQTSIKRLDSARELAELQPNTYYLNHNLYGYLRAGDRPGLWSLFLRATQTHRTLTPDLATFTCLWDAEKAHITANPATRRDLARQANIQFPGPRSLFARMNRWLSSLPPNSRAEVASETSHDLYTQILRSFSLSLDLPGTLIALYVLHHEFGLVPDADDVRLVSIQLARSSEPSRGGWKTRRVGRLGDRKESQARLQRIAGVLKIVGDEREARLAEMGVKKDELSEEMQGQEGLWVLGSLVRRFMEAQWEEKAERWGEGDKRRVLDEEIEKLAWKMGVGGLRMGAPVYEKIAGTVDLVGYEGLEVGEAPAGTCSEELD